MQESQARPGSHRHFYLSWIQSVMEEDEEETSFDHGEMVAKVSELGDILKEDSPAFRPDFSPRSQIAAPSSFTRKWPPSIQFSNFQSQTVLSTPQISTGLSMSKGLGLPQGLVTRLSRLMSAELLDDTRFRNTSTRPCLQEEGENAGESFDDPIVEAAHFDNFGRIADMKHGRSAAIIKLQKERGQKDRHRAMTFGCFVDLNDLLLHSARAIGSNDTKTAMALLVKVKQFASPSGNGAQRVAHYFAEALEARIAGTGWQIYMGRMGINRPSADTIWKAACMYMTNSPFVKAFRFFANRNILDALKDASTLHIVEYQVTGSEYPSLFQALAARAGGPPKVRLVAVNIPRYSWVCKDREGVLNMLEKTGREITMSAALYGVPFHFTAWAGNVEAFKIQDYVSGSRNPEEVVVVIARYPLAYSYEDILKPPGRRLQLFKGMHAVKPAIFIHGVALGSYSTPFFMHRFRAALHHFSSHYDMLDTFVHRKHASRRVFESEVLGKAVLSIIACEDVNVVERVDRQTQWYADLKKAGFRPVRLTKDTKVETEKILKSWHSDYMIEEDLNYLLMRWRGRILYGLAMWRTGNGPLEESLGKQQWEMRLTKAFS